VRNFSNTTIRVIGKCGDQQSCGSDKTEDFILYKKEILKITRGTHLKTIDKIEIERIGDEIQFDIPANSTAYLKPFFWTSLKGSDQPIIECRIMANGLVIDSLSIEPWTKNDKIKRTGGLLVKNVYYYDYM
jgi:hypothetical protein